MISTKNTVLIVLAVIIGIVLVAGMLATSARITGSLISEEFSVSSSSFDPEQ